MKTFVIVLLFLIIFRIFKPDDKLYDFDSRATLPLRGVLALFIMFHHVSQKYDFSFGIKYLELHPSLSFNLFSSMGACIVGIFFFLTGYGLAKSLSKKGNEYLLGFIRKRFIGTLPEFIFLTIIVSMFFIFTELRSVSDIFSNFCAGDPPLPTSWFMYAIIYVYISFYLSAIISRCNIKLTGYILTVFIVLYMIFMYKLNWGAYWYISIPSVSLGYLVAIYEHYINRILQNRILMILLIVIPSIIVLFFHKNLMMIYDIVIMCYVCMRLYRMPSWGILIWLGDISLNIYLIHSLYLMWFTYHQINPLVALVSVIFLSCISAYGLKELRKKIFNC